MEITVDLRDTLTRKDTVYFRYFGKESGEGFAPTESRIFFTVEELMPTLLSTICAEKEIAKMISISKKNLGVRMFLQLPSRWQASIKRKLIAIITTLLAEEISASEREGRGSVSNAPETIPEPTCVIIPRPKQKEDNTKSSPLSQKMLNGEDFWNKAIKAPSSVNPLLSWEGGDNSCKS